MSALSIEVFKRSQDLVGVFVTMEYPNDFGVWWLDLAYQGREVTVLYRPDKGYGLYLPKPEEDIGYGDLPDEHYDTLEQTWARMLAVLQYP